MIKKSFLGTGWAFPVQFVRDSTAAVQMASEIQDIEQSLTILLSTRPGERVMRYDYGCALDDLLFEPANVSLLTYIEDLIKKSILYYEPRVQLREVRVNTDGLLEGRVLIELDVVVRATNSRFNYVFDYYQREATLQPA